MLRILGVIFEGLDGRNVKRSEGLDWQASAKAGVVCWRVPFCCGFKCKGGRKAEPNKLGYSLLRHPQAIPVRVTRVVLFSQTPGLFCSFCWRGVGPLEEATPGFCNEPRWYTNTAPRFLTSLQKQRQSEDRTLHPSWVSLKLLMTVPDSQSYRRTYGIYTCIYIYIYVYI